MMLETDRLRVRHFEEADLDEFAALCADIEVMRCVGDGTTLERAEVAHWIDVCQEKYAKRGYGTSAIFERDTGAFVGYCGVVGAPDVDFDELIYVFHQNFWGNGYATEIGREMLAYVFELSSLQSIAATIDPGSRQSKLVAAKLGMVETPLADNTVSHWILKHPAT